jgi:hypothetical protein
MAVGSFWSGRCSPLSRACRGGFELDVGRTELRRYDTSAEHAAAPHYAAGLAPSCVKADGLPGSV